MTHKTIETTCAALGLTVAPVPATGRRSYEAKGTEALPRVYWSTSTEGGLLGLPRVIRRDGHDTHARSTKEIAYLVKA